jgi:hypothetical protein
MTYFSPLLRLVQSIACCLLIAAVSPPLAADAPQASWLYRETTGREVKEFEWRRSFRAGQEVISVHEENGTFVNRCDRSGRTLSWEFRQGEATNIDVVRSDNELRISGSFKDRRIDYTRTIDDRPWYQPLSFSLRFFLESGLPETSFWTIRADTLDVVTMRAHKLGIEEIDVAGGRTPAFKVEIRRDGLLSSFWHGTFWFRKDDLQFVRYTGVHGPPGTSETVVQLLSGTRRR